MTGWLRPIVTLAVLAMLTGAPALGAACVMACLPVSPGEAAAPGHAVHDDRHGDHAGSERASTIDADAAVAAAAVHDCERTHPAHSGPVLSPPAGRGETVTLVRLAAATIVTLGSRPLMPAERGAPRAVAPVAPPGVSSLTPLVLRI